MLLRRRRRRRRLRRRPPQARRRTVLVVGSAAPASSTADSILKATKTPPPPSKPGRPPDRNVIGQTRANRAHRADAFVVLPSMIIYDNLNKVRKPRPSAASTTSDPSKQGLCSISVLSQTSSTTWTIGKETMRRLYRPALDYRIIINGTSEPRRRPLRRIVPDAIGALVARAQGDRRALDRTHPPPPTLDRRRPNQHRRLRTRCWPTATPTTMNVPVPRPPAVRSKQRAQRPACDDV